MLQFHKEGSTLDNCQKRKPPGLCPAHRELGISFTSGLLSIVHMAAVACMERAEVQSLAADLWDLGQTRVL